MPKFVSIALPLPTPREFSYIIPESMRQSALVGVRALVPFGKRTLTGVIVADEDVPAVEKPREIYELLDPEPIYSAEMLKFTHWIAEYYIASWGETLRAALPQGISPESVLRIKATQHISQDELLAMATRAPRRAQLLAELLEHDNEVTIGYLEKLLNSVNIHAQLEALEKLGYIEVQRRVEPRVKIKVQKALAPPPGLVNDEARLKEVMDELDRSAPKQSVLFSHVYIHALHHEEALIMADALRDTRCSSKVADALLAKGLLVKYDAEVFRNEQNNDNTLARKDETQLKFTLEQEHVVDKVSEALQSRRFKTFLVHGVTGSGKTLVYIQAIRETLASGRQALLLVPEISLTPQLIDRFQRVFGSEIAVFHSGMSGGERYDTWRAARSGKARIVIGTRSAIFSPLAKLGIIIVDEEHEPSYKQDAPAPRYNARDCAIVRGRLENAVVVLGSATPSVESMFNAQNGKYHLLEITSRADGANLPLIQPVDVMEERKRKQMIGSFSRTLLDAVISRLQKKEGIILFQNLRGFASRLECPDCGDIPMCVNCSVSLTYHRYRNQLRCHYCGYTIIAERACKVCGYPEMREFGAGTQRIEEELADLLKGYALHPVIQRVDLDTTGRKGALRKILTAFHDEKIDILVGTQMVSKGLDFERVTLVGVISADVHLTLPDFRAVERTYQLLTQVAGRAGRSSEKTGEVIIQTRKPKNKAVLATLANAYHLFYNDELQERKDAHYPPFSRFVTIEFSGKNEETVHLQANHFAYYLPRAHKSLITLGPAIPTIARIRTDYRRIIVLKNIKEFDPQGVFLRHAILHAYQLYNKKHASSAIRISIDVDAHGFL